jgi:hypothetical protein
MQALSSRSGAGRFTAVQQRQHAAGRATVRVAAQKKQLMMWEALREAVDEEMEKDPTVCVMGEQKVTPVPAAGINWLSDRTSGLGSVVNPKCGPTSLLSRAHTAQGPSPWPAAAVLKAKRCCCCCLICAR